MCCTWVSALLSIQLDGFCSAANIAAALCSLHDKSVHPTTSFANPQYGLQLGEAVAPSGSQQRMFKRHNRDVQLAAVVSSRWS